MAHHPLLVLMVVLSTVRLAMPELPGLHQPLKIIRTTMEALHPAATIRRHLLILAAVPSLHVMVMDHPSMSIFA